MHYWIYIYFFLILIAQAQQEDICMQSSRGEFINHERSLLSCLLSDYKPDLRPTTKPGQAINVTLHDMILLPDKMNEIESTLSMRAFSILGWIDPQLTWNESMFGNLKEVSVLKKKIWLPTYRLLNTLNSLHDITYEEYISVNSSGYVRWTPFRLFEVRCTYEYTRFPYDNQHCFFLFIFPAFDFTIMNYEDKNLLIKTDTSSYWALKSFTKTIYMHKDKDFLGIYFNIILLRNSPFDQVVLVLPSVIMAMIIFALFWTPIDSNQRFVISGALMISLFILMTTVKFLLPIDIAGVPIIVIFLSYLLVMLFFSTVISLFSYNFFYRDYRKQQIPDLVRKILLNRYLSKVLLVSNKSFYDKSLIIDPNNSSKYINDLYLTTNGSASSNGSDLVGYLSTERPTVESTIYSIKKYLMMLVNKKSGKGIDQSEKKVHQDLILSEWHKLSLTIDRLSSLIYLFITFLVMVILVGVNSKPSLPYDK